jgi:beta,beta-carotene 9',10'-dioxygenase
MTCDNLGFPIALSKAAILVTIPSSWKTNMSYYHSFGMSENYIVFIEQPLIINSMKLVTSQVKGKCMRDCMTWSPEEQVSARVMIAAVPFLQCR